MERGIWKKPNSSINNLDPHRLSSSPLSPACPRCGSSNTKFCYYNNYSLTQPRYFCKSCRRYWTKGGSLRNVPVGGGCRKSRRAKSRNLQLLPQNNNNNNNNKAISDVSTSTTATIDLAAVYANFLNQTPRPDQNYRNQVNESSSLSHDQFTDDGIGLINRSMVRFPGFQGLDMNHHLISTSSHLSDHQHLLGGGGNLGFFGELEQQQQIIAMGSGFMNSGLNVPVESAILPPLPGEEHEHVVGSEGIMWAGSDVNMLQNETMSSMGGAEQAGVQGHDDNPGPLDGIVSSSFSPLINLEAIFRS